MFKRHLLVLFKGSLCVLHVVSCFQRYILLVELPLRMQNILWDALSDVICWNLLCVIYFEKATSCYCISIVEVLITHKALAWYTVGRFASYQEKTSIRFSIMSCSVDWAEMKGQVNVRSMRIIGRGWSNCMAMNIRIDITIALQRYYCTLLMLQLTVYKEQRWKHFVR